MHALLALLLVAAPTPASRIKALYEELPELALPLEFKSGGMPDRPKASPENVAALKAALRARVEHGDRAFLEAMTEDPAPNASPPITLEFWVFGRVTMAGSAAILCELYRNEGEGGPDDVLGSQVYLITLSPKSGTIIDTRGVYTWSSNEGEPASKSATTRFASA